MNERFNVLLTSISKKVPWIQAVKRSLKNLRIKGKIIGADSNLQSIGRFFVDDFWEMPILERLDIEDLINYCAAHKIRAIIPSRDGELPFFAKHKKKLHSQGIACLISSVEPIEICRDKLKFSHFLAAHGFPNIPSTPVLKGMKSPTFTVKEQFGAGSHSIGLNLSRSEAKEWAAVLQHPIFQPFVKGEEYSIDLYVDRSGFAKGAIARSRDYVAGGESQVTTSVKHSELENTCLKLAEALGLYGHAIMQVLIDKKGNLHIVECNARFGGASTLSIAMGLNSFEWFFLEALGRPLPPFHRASGEKRQVRYAENLIMPLGGRRTN
jgi:carbamoyl-phosphate synthase large subunit